MRVGICCYSSFWRWFTASKLEPDKPDDSSEHYADIMETGKKWGSGRRKRAVVILVSLERSILTPASLIKISPGFFHSRT